MKNVYGYIFLLDGVCNPVRNVFSCWMGFAIPNVTFPIRNYSALNLVQRIRGVNGLMRGVIRFSCWTGFATPSVTFPIQSKTLRSQLQTGVSQKIGGQEIRFLAKIGFLTKPFLTQPKNRRPRNPIFAKNRISNQAISNQAQK